MDKSSNTKELLEIYKGLAQCNYKEPSNGDFGDCTKEVLADLQARTSNQRKGAIKKQDGNIFSKEDSCSSKFSSI